MEWTIQYTCSGELRELKFVATEDIRLEKVIQLLTEKHPNQKIRIKNVKH